MPLPDETLGGADEEDDDNVALLGLGSNEVARPRLSYTRTRVIERSPMLAAAELIYDFRRMVVAGWLLAAVVLAPCAFWLCLSATPQMVSTAPPGTESTLAYEKFVKHFPDIVQDFKQEMVVFICRARCSTAGTEVSRGHVKAITDILDQFDAAHPGVMVQSESYFTMTALDPNPYLSIDHQSLLLHWAWSVPSDSKAQAFALLSSVQTAIDGINEASDPVTGFEAAATGILYLEKAFLETLATEIPVHEIKCIWMPFLILAFALRSVRMLSLALIGMPIEILVAFGLVYVFSLGAHFSMYCLMMMLLLMTSLTFDYSLFTLTRYAEERVAGASTRNAILTMISQSGRVVTVSGCVLIVAWSALLYMPDPFRTFCIGTSSMIAVCVGVQLTFVPALLSLFPILGLPAGQVDDNSQPPSNYCRTPWRRSDTYTENHLKKAAAHMQGTGFQLGKRLTAHPVNKVVPAVVYTLMMPLTLRWCRAIDFNTFSWRMGHSFVMQVPRTRNEWFTALQIQRDFPSETSTLMPLELIATSPSSLDPVNGDLPPEESGYAPTNKLLNVEHQAFFDANCRMVNAVIEATRGKPYALGAGNFLSPTVHGEYKGGVRCVKYWQLNMLRTNYFSKQWLFSSHAKLVDTMWHRFVSGKSHALLTLVMTSVDPFSPEAFSLMEDIRAVLRNTSQFAEAAPEVGLVEGASSIASHWSAMRKAKAAFTQAATGAATPIPGPTFAAYSAGGVMMDLIAVAQHALPTAFVGCVAVCFILIALWFWAFFVPIKLFVTVVWPITWTYGAALYLYEDGLLAWTGIPAISPTGDAGLDWSVPILTLTFLLGLALDYDVFLFERIWEFRKEGFGDRESIQLGLSATGPIISSAGGIMALTFSSQLMGTVPITNQLGFILVFSIVMDTFLVRTVLVPCMLSLRPSINYWPTRMPPPRFEWLAAGKEPPSSYREAMASQRRWADAE
mmetsp:Transcript_84489/g.235696  ORF Transcript_84489/g.235696 Transcript_84489/m.235696 type:complete len:960 (+) Transcript_84489:122-3001(+)